MNGHDRAVITAHWIRTKPVSKSGDKIPLEEYVKQVCKAKKWDYKAPTPKKEGE